jgi:peptidyl-tRNA hydrolase ICT1
MEYLLPLLPSILHTPIRQSRYYAAKSDSIVIQADDSRKQTDNADHCFVKLHNMVTEAGVNILPGETSQAQKEHVKTLYVHLFEHSIAVADSLADRNGRTRIV